MLTKTFYLIQEVPGEWNGLIWPMSPASLVSSLDAGGRKMLIQQAQEQMSAGKLYNASPGCTCAPYFSFSFGFPFPSIQQGHLRKLVFQSHWMLPRGFTLSTLNSSYPRPQRGSVALGTNANNAGIPQEIQGVSLTEVTIGGSGFCQGLCAQRLLICFFLVFPGKTQSSGSEEKLYTQSSCKT